MPSVWNELMSIIQHKNKSDVAEWSQACHDIYGVFCYFYVHSMASTQQLRTFVLNQLWLMKSLSAMGSSLIGYRAMFNLFALRFFEFPFPAPLFLMILEDPHSGKFLSGHSCIVSEACHVPSSMTEQLCQLVPGSGGQGLAFFQSFPHSAFGNNFLG